MKQLDVLLRQRPSDYVIQVGQNKVYSIIIPERHHSIKLVIENLVDRQGIYGDELLPLIFHLTSSDIECLLNVSLLAGSFLSSYDDYTLGELDGYLLETIDRLSSYNDLVLKQGKVVLRSTTSLGLSDSNISLATQMAAMLKKYISTSNSYLSLSTTLSCTNVSVVRPAANHMALLNSIVSRIVNQVFLNMTERGIHWFDGRLSDYDDLTLSEMDNYFPKMSLKQVCGDVYMQFTIPLGNFDIGLVSQIADFLINTTLNAEQSSIILASAITPVTLNSFIGVDTRLSDYDDFLLSDMSDKLLPPLDGYLSTPLISTIVSAVLESFPESDGFDLSCGDYLSQNVDLQTALSVSNSQTIQTMMTDTIEMIYGLEFYDDDLLMTWDSTTLEDMAEAARIA